jgi:hypothetical protein
MSELRAIPLSEFLKRPLPTLAQRMEKWGGWKPHRIGEITYPAYLPGGTYPIDLETLTSSAEVPDMICQVAMKEWATDVCISGLVRAINVLLQPQAHLCSMGADRRLHGDEIVRLTKWAREQVNISSNRLALLPPNALFRANAVPDDAGFGAEE